MSEFNPPFDFAALVRSRKPSGKFILTISKRETPGGLSGKLAGSRGARRLPSLRAAGTAGRPRAPVGFPPRESRSTESGRAP